MSSNVTQFPQSARLPLWRKVLRYLLIALAVLLVLTPLFLWEPLDLDRPLRSLRYGGVGRTVSFEAHSSNAYAPCGNSLLISSASSVKLCPFDQKEGVLEAVGFSSPISIGGSRYALGVDVGGSQYVVSDGRKGTLTAKTMSGDILDADITKTGVYCVATSEGGYKTVLRLFGKNGQEMFRWFSASQFFQQCACSPDGQQMAATSFGVENGSYCSELHFFHTNKDEIAATVSVSGALVYDLRYFGNNTLCVVSEDGVRFYSKDGILRGEWLFDDDLIDYDLSSDQFVLLALNTAASLESTTLITLDCSARVLGQALVSGKCRSVSANGRYAALLTDAELLIYRSNLSGYACISDISDMRHMFVRSDGSAVLIGNNRAELVLPQ